ncbi:MAG: gamma-glutamylcyclotransferase [Actinobacteria bacterium]|nr:gamma-glutamylcyclotransferase [Actinomycetota bacterium]
MSSPLPDSILYFAYGTLLGATSMQGHCASAVRRGQAYLPDYELALQCFGDGPRDGGCALSPLPGMQTFGVLYEIPGDEWSALKELSGVGTAYRVLPVVVFLADGSRVEAETLTITNPKGPYRPPDDYLDLITVGAMSAELPLEYQGHLLRIVSRAAALSNPPPDG